MENLSDALDSKDKLKLDRLNDIISNYEQDEQSLLIISCDTLDLNLKLEEYLTSNTNYLIKIDNVQDGLFKQILQNKENFKNKYILINLFSIDKYEAIRDEFQFKRDYIPQERLKFIFLLNFTQYESFKTKAYDFFSFNNFFHFFSDNSFTFVNDIDLSELDDMIEEYENIKDTNISKQSRMKYLFDIGEKAYDFSQYSLGLEYFNEALKIANKLKDIFMKSCIYNLIGNIYTNLGDNNTALRYQKDALKYFKRIKNQDGISTIHISIGNIYLELENYDLSLTNYEKALVIAQKEKNNYNIASTLGNIGLIYQSKDELDKALKYQEESLLIQKEIENKKGIADTFVNIGLIYQSKDELDKALKYQEESLLINKDIVNNLGVVNSLASIGSIYKDKKDFDLALKYQKEALTIAKKLGLNGIIKKIEEER
ncbi:MAG: tetratricopeptide repeat protein [Campylobacterota bacterium]|nr:tetratricopeptide repeat protein [Campylobacterota bacterium]